MKITKLLIIVSIVALVVLAGCTSNAERSYPRPSGPVGGGCGVAAPAEDNSAVQTVAVPEKAEAL